MFLILTSKSSNRTRRQKGVIRYGDVNSQNSFSMYNIDQLGNVSVNNPSVDNIPAGVRDEQTQVLHHQDIDLLSEVFIGQVVQHRYFDGGKLFRLAQNDRFPTRLIDLQPGMFNDKIQIEMRLVDILEEVPEYQALSWTWKETAYEHGHHPSFTRDDNAILNLTSNIRHAVYCHAEDGRDFPPYQCRSS